MTITVESIEVLKSYLRGKDSVKRECLDVIEHLQTRMWFAAENIEKENYSAACAMLTLPEKE